jgi:NAD+ synthetase
MALPVLHASAIDPHAEDVLAINAALVSQWLVRFLQDECIRRRKVGKAVIGLSGGVDSAVVAYLCATAFGPENVFAYRMPYKISSQESLDHAQLVVDDLGINCRTIEITPMVDGYVLTNEADISPSRLGNVCARCRMITIFDQSARVGALPIGTGNKSERLFGYYTWHADDLPPSTPSAISSRPRFGNLQRPSASPAPSSTSPRPPIW